MSAYIYYKLIMIVYNVFINCAQKKTSYHLYKFTIERRKENINKRMMIENKN